jgi:hypothetical protein
LTGSTVRATINDSGEVIMLAYLFIIIAIGFRFIPHPLAFTPVAAALLFFGAHQPRKRFWVPLVLFAATDVILTKLVYSYPFPYDTFVDWAWYAAILFLGAQLAGKFRPGRIFAASLAASISFFVVSNFAVWLFFRNMYPMTLSGLSACYAAAIPFFRNEVVADLVFSFAFFGTPMLLRLLSGESAADDTATV